MEKYTSMRDSTTRNLAKSVSGSRPTLSLGQTHPALFLLLSLSLFAAGCNNGGSNPAPPVDNTSFRVALSVSPFSELIFDAGLSLNDGQTTAGSVPELAQLFMNHGGNELFARISTERTASAIGEDRSLARGVSRAGLAASVSQPLNPELGLFGSYGDHSCQTAPDFRNIPR
jgi:hypothetical protein